MTVQTVLKCLNDNAYRAVVHREMERAPQNEELRGALDCFFGANPSLFDPYRVVLEAHMTSLNLALARMLGPRDKRNASVSQLFAFLKGLDLAGWEQDRLQTLERAKDTFAKLEKDPRTRAILMRRHKLLSHTDTTKKPWELPTHAAARTLLDDVLNLVNDLNLAINGEALDFDECVTDWKLQAAAFWRHFMC